MVQGTLYIVSAPSGAGKSTLFNALINTPSTNDICFSVSHTTRQPRQGERQGEDYHFISEERFHQMIQENAFLEHAQVFGHYYGSSREAIEKVLTQGIDVFLDIDWQGARQVRKKMPRARSIFILPPSLEELKRRLDGRSQDSGEAITQRMQQAAAEISHYNEYDYVILNKELDIALQDLRAIIRAERLGLEQQKLRHAALISKLLED